MRTIFPDDTARTRRSDPLTSHEAADSNDHAVSRGVVYAELRKVDFGLADFELQQRLAGRFSPERIRTARHELAEAGLVESLGIYRLTRAGRRAQVWGTTPKGETS